MFVQINCKNEMMVNFKGSIGLNFEWNYTQLKFKPRTVEKNESIISPPAGIEPTLLRCPCNALATEHEL